MDLKHPFTESHSSTRQRRAPVPFAVLRWDSDVVWLITAEERGQTPTGIWLALVPFPGSDGGGGGVALSGWRGGIVGVPCPRLRGHVLSRVQTSSRCEFGVNHRRRHAHASRGHDTKIQVFGSRLYSKSLESMRSSVEDNVGTEPRSIAIGSSTPVLHAWALDHGKSSGRLTRPRFTGF